jgi:septum site-determining protein MinC
MANDSRNQVPIFEIKSASLSLVSFVLKTADLRVLSDELNKRLADSPDFFSNDPVLLDLSQLDTQAPPPDFARLRQILAPWRIHPVAVSGGTSDQVDAAFRAGLPYVQPDEHASEHSHHHPGEREIIREVVKEIPALPAHTLFVDKPLRAGQVAYAKGADMVVLAAVNQGAEIIADGSIHVYAPLKGKAMAGMSGNRQARIFTTSLEADLVAITGIYRTRENDYPREVSGKPAQIRLEGDHLLIEPLHF